MRTLRWALVLPAAVGSWYATFAVGLMTHQWLEAVLCPPDQMSSGTCMSAIVNAWMARVVVFFVGVSAVAVVGVAAAVAPEEKKLIAWCAFGTGALVAIFCAVAADAYAEGAAAVLAGLATALFVSRRRAESPR